MKSPQCAIQIIVITDLGPLTKYISRKQTEQSIKKLNIKQVYGFLELHRP